MNRDAAMMELENARCQLLGMVNSKIDALKIRVENGEPVDIDCLCLSGIEMMYPLDASPALFKGTKPTALYFGDEKVAVGTWRKAFTLILQRCAGVSEHRDMLMHLRNKISGRKRVILSDKPDGMDVPIKITDGVFAEGDFDTEWLIRILTTGILDVVRFDYSGISVSVVKNKRRRMSSDG